MSPGSSASSCEASPTLTQWEGVRGRPAHVAGGGGEGGGDGTQAEPRAPDPLTARHGPALPSQGRGSAYGAPTPQASLPTLERLSIRAQGGQILPSLASSSPGCCSLGSPASQRPGGGRLARKDSAREASRKGQEPPTPEPPALPARSRVIPLTGLPDLPAESPFLPF